jgi:hypothetical protein
LVGGQLAISEDLVKQAGADGLARVRGHNRAPAILVTEEMMAAFDGKNAKASLFEAGTEVSSGDAGVSGSCRDGHALDANELQILLRRALDFQT